MLPEEAAFFASSTPFDMSDTSDESAIEFLYEDIDFVLEEQGEMVAWIQQIIETHQFTLENLTYIFCSDEYLRQINQEFLNKDYYTDIITFDNSDLSEVIEGDVFVSVERVRENAAERNIPFRDELHRVIIHGVLHLLGYTDKDTLSETAMRRKEDGCLSLRQF
jgi:rRNA maturation RNase YbeY